MYENEKYKPNQIILSKTGGSGTFTVLQNGIFQVAVVGGGSGSSTYIYGAPRKGYESTGASAGCILVEAKLFKNTSYTWSVGGGGSAWVSPSSVGNSGAGGTTTFKNTDGGNIKATGGQSCSTLAPGGGGSYGYTSSSLFEIQTIISYHNGKAGVGPMPGEITAGGPSTGIGTSLGAAYGYGGDVGPYVNPAGKGGYVRVMYLRKR